MDYKKCREDEEDVLLHRAKCMSEEDPNQNDVSQASVKEKKPRWGPQHAGAMELASGYTKSTSAADILFSHSLILFFLSHFHNVGYLNYLRFLCIFFNFTFFLIVNS